MAEIDVLDPTSVDKVITIINNIVYKGNNNTTEEIDAKLKSTLQSCFTDFFGAQHGEQIAQKIEDMGINRCFQILGSKNSIQQFLLEFKAKTFNDLKKKPLYNPETLEYYATTPIDEILEYSKRNSNSRDRLQNLCDFLGINIASLSFPNGKARFSSLVNAALEEYKNTPYSRDGELNDQLQYLEEYMLAYQQYIQSTFEQGNLTLEDYVDNPEQVKKFDPVFKKTTENIPDIMINSCIDNLLLPTSSVEAFESQGNLYFGLNPEGSVIIHEALHGITFKEDIFTDGFSFLGSNKYFNEVITEYFSQIIYTKYLANNGEALTRNMTWTGSAYEYLFEYMSGFIKTFEPEIKEVLMRDNPVSDIQSIIGEKKFKKISTCCDDIYILGHAANLQELHRIIGNKIELGTNIVALAANTNMARLKKSPLEAILNAISINAEDIANRLKSSNAPECIKKLAGSIYELSDQINQHTQGHVASKLDQNNSTQPTISDTQEPEDDLDDEIVMEMKFNPNGQQIL